MPGGGIISLHFTSICAHNGTEMRAQSRARINRVRSVNGWWGEAHSFQLTLKIKM